MFEIGFFIKFLGVKLVYLRRRDVYLKRSQIPSNTFKKKIYIFYCLKSIAYDVLTDANVQLLTSYVRAFTSYVRIFIAKCPGIYRSYFEVSVDNFTFI